MSTGEHGSRCFIHLVNSTTWQALTGHKPPTQPPTAKRYTDAGFPWFDYYDKDLTALNGSKNLGGLKSVKEMGEEKRTRPLPENESVSVGNLVDLRSRLKPNQVRESNCPNRNPVLPAESRRSPREAGASATAAQKR